MIDRTQLRVAHRCTCAALVSAMIALPLVLPASAQDLYGSVVGVVKDSQGGVLPGAAVVLINRNTGLKREATTNTEGGYTFANVLGGAYDVRVTMAGFR